MLDTSIKSCIQANDKIDRVNMSVQQLRGEVTIVKNAVEELKQLMEKHNRKSFSLKDEGYEVCRLLMSMQYHARKHFPNKMVYECNYDY